MSLPAAHVPGDDSAPLVPIDPFSGARDGAYRDSHVEVRSGHGPPARRSLHMVRTRHFDVTHHASRVCLVHRVPPDRIDDDLSGLLAEELFTPGWLRGAELFERLFTGIVLTSGPDPLGCWTLFYANTLRRVEASLGTAPGPDSHGTVPGYAPVYAIAERLLAPGTVLELGSCFGFLSLRLAAAGRRVTASDVNPGTVALLRAVAPVLGVRLETCLGDASRFPAPDAAADNVLLVHLLEHLEPAAGARALGEAIRLARRRVVVAVPLEDEADETWGHVRTVSLADLEAWGAASGLAHQVHEEHGGWLLIDTRP